MTIFHQKESVLISIIHCPVCGKFYAVNTEPFKPHCLVYHGPGTCCHYGDFEVSGALVKELADVLAKEVVDAEYKRRLEEKKGRGTEGSQSSQANPEVPEASPGEGKGS